MPDTSIADTSTEDINSSVDVSMKEQPESSPEPAKVPDKEPSPPPEPEKPEPKFEEPVKTKAVSFIYMNNLKILFHRISNHFLMKFIINYCASYFMKLLILIFTFLYVLHIYCICVKIYTPD